MFFCGVRPRSGWFGLLVFPILSFVKAGNQLKMPKMVNKNILRHRAESAVAQSKIYKS